MSPTDTASRREFARLVACSPALVQRLVSRGELPTDSNGKILIASGVAAYARLRTIASPAATVGVTPGARPPVDDVGAVPEGAPLERPRAAAHSPDAVIAAELRRKEADTQLKELKLRRESGALVERATVRQEAQAVCTAVRSTLLALPARVALQIEQLIASTSGALRASKVQRLIEDEVNLALEALHEGRLAAPATAAASAGGGL